MATFRHFKSSNLKIPKNILERIFPSIVDFRKFEVFKNHISERRLDGFPVSLKSFCGSKVKNQLVLGVVDMSTKHEDFAGFLGKFKLNVFSSP